jgi:predicted glycoside hydrolase/deacetylase ChbG (UPF0249 family)/pimeloyl-ACP methyl ester carboxylesterase
MESVKHFNTKHGNLRGIIHQPEVEVPKGVIIFIHGYFSSNKLGPANLYVQLSRFFQELGYIVWRFDIIGVGDSDGLYSDITYQNHIRDVNTLIIKAKEKYPFKISLCGHSSGANIALELLKFHSDIKMLLLISPAFGTITGCAGLLNKEQIRELHNNGNTIRKGLIINVDYYIPFQSDEIFEKAKLILPKCFYFIAMKDQFYNSELMISKLEEQGIEQILKIPDAEHNFLDLSCRKILFNEIKQVLLKSTKKIIITADDYGMSESFDKGIIELASLKYLSSIGVMVNRIKSSNSITILKEVSLKNNISIGLHLEFMTKDFKKEIDSQLNRFNGFFSNLPSYVDVHKGIKFKDSFPIIIDYALKYKIPFRNHGIEDKCKDLRQTSVPFYFGTGKKAIEIINWIEGTPFSSIIELVFHPGYQDKNSKSSLNIEREADMNTIKLLQKKLKKYDYDIINYDSL